MVSTVVQAVIGGVTVRAVAVAITQVVEGLVFTTVELGDIDVGDIELEAGSQNGEDRADPFGRWQLDEAVDIEPLECLPIGVADQRTLCVVYPEVVRAREAAGVPEELLGDRRTSVPASAVWITLPTLAILTPRRAILARVPVCSLATVPRS